MEQPSLEFLLTDHYQFAQTGSAKLNNLKIFLLGSPGHQFNFPIPETLIGHNCLQRVSDESLIIDAALDGLSFTGYTFTVKSFTMGYYRMVITGW